MCTVVKYTLVGCGRIAKNHIGAAKGCPDIKITGVCDTERGKAEDLAVKYDLKTNIYSDYITMLDAERPDFVAIATDSGSHAKIALEAIGRGCHVIIEKPVALSLKDADDLIHLAEEKGVVASVCHQNRFNPAVLHLHRAVSGGRLGRLLYGAAAIRWNRGDDYYHQAKWRGRWATDGGALMNQCIHDIDLLRWFMGRPTEVMSITARQLHSIEAEDFGAALVKFEGGSFGIIEGTTNVYPANLEETLCIFGTEGTVKLGGSSLNRLEHWQLADGIDNVQQLKQIYSENPPDVYGYGHAPLYRNVTDVIINGGKPFITLNDGREALSLVLAVYKSAAAGKPVSMPLSKASTLDFVGRFT